MTSTCGFRVLQPHTDHTCLKAATLVYIEHTSASKIPNGTLAWDWAYEGEACRLSTILTEEPHVIRSDIAGLISW
jgi:hypothetical protein